MHMSSNDDGWDDESIAAFNNTLNRLMNDMNADTERVSFAEDRFLLRQFDDELSRTLAPAPGGSGEECVDGWRKPSPDHFERHHDSSLSRPGSSSQGTDTRSYRNVMHTLLTQLIHLSLSEREAARMVYTRAKVEDLYGVRGFKKLLTQCDMILPSDSQLQVMLVDAHRTLVVEEPPAPLGRHLHPCHSNGGMDGWHTARTLAKALLTGRRSRRSSARGPSLFPAAAATDASGGARSNRLSSVVSPDASPSSSLPSGHGGGGGSVTQRGGSARGTGQSSQSSSDDIFISLQVFWFCLERLKRRQYDELVEHDVQAVESVLQEAIEAIMTDSAFIDELPVTESNQQATGSGRSNATVGSATDIGGDAGKITPVRLDEYLSHVFGVKLFASDVSSSDAAPTTSLPSMSMQPSLSMVASWASKLKHDEEAAAHHGVLGPTELLSALNQNGEPPSHVTKNSDDIFGTHHGAGDAQHTLHLQGIASRMRSAVFLQRGGRQSSSLAVDDGSDGNVTMMHNHHVPMLALQRPSSMGSPLLPPSGVDTSSSHRYSLAPVTLGHSPRSNSPHSSTRQQKSIASTLFLAAPSGTVRGSVSPTTSTPASARSSSDDNRPSMHEGDSVIVAMAPPAAAPRPSTLSNSPTGSRPPTGTSSPFDTSRNRKVNPYVSTAFLPMPSLMDTSNVVEPQRSQINILEDSSHQQQPVLISRTSSSVNMWSPGQSRPGTAGGGSTDTGSPVGSPTSSLRDMRREAASRKQQYQVRMERLKADILSQMTHDHARRSCHSASSPTQRRGRTHGGGSPVRPASATVGVSKSERSAAAAVGGDDDEEEEVSRSYSPLNDPHVARYYGAHGNSNIYCRAALLSHRPNSSTAASSAKTTHDGENKEANDLPAVVTSTTTTTRQQQQQRPVVGDKINARCVSAGVRGPRIATQVREYALVALEHLATDLNALRSCPPKKEHKPRKSLPLVCRRV